MTRRPRSEWNRNLISSNILLILFCATSHQINNLLAQTLHPTLTLQYSYSLMSLVSTHETYVILTIPVFYSLIILIILSPLNSYSYRVLSVSISVTAMQNTKTHFTHNSLTREFLKHLPSSLALI